MSTDSNGGDVPSTPSTRLIIFGWFLFYVVGFASACFAWWFS